MLSYICNLVGEFNFLFGVIDEEYDFSSTETKTFLFDKNNNNFNKKQVILRYSLIFEEIKELNEAIHNGDIIETIDALCDILYVVAGAKVYFNYKDDDLNYIMNSDNQKLNVYETKILFQNNFDIVHKTSIDMELECTKIKDITDLIINKYYDNEIIFNYNQYLNNIIKYVFEISLLLNINIIKFFDIVHKSNMSKICLYENEAIQTIQNYLKDTEKRYKTPTYRKKCLKNIVYYIIYDENTNKILKNINYTSVYFI